jgi:predicted alpha/beta superfamily hydrolase
MRFILAAFSLLIAATSAWAAPPTLNAPPPSSSAPYLANVSTFLMTSKRSGRTYQISVALPQNYDPSHGPYPVLYTLDANALFGMAVESSRLLAGDRRMPPVVVVGVGYARPGVGFQTLFAERTLDLTPTNNPDELTWLVPYARAAGLPEPKATGGGPLFFAFLQTELAPALEARWAISRTDRALFGDSLGGLFAIYALLHNDGFFQRFVIGSPTLGWDHEAMFKDEARYYDRDKAMPARIFTAVGGLEETADDTMISDWERFFARLQSRNYNGLMLDSEVVNGQDHLSVPLVTLLHGLENVYQGWATTTAKAAPAP